MAAISGFTVAESSGAANAVGIGRVQGATFGESPSALTLSGPLTFIVEDADLLSFEADDEDLS